MPEALKQLINSISYLPWIWEKSATKLAFFLLNSNENYIKNFKESITWVREKIARCDSCNSLCDILKNTCSICSNKSRDHDKIMVVEEYLDMITIEQSWGYSWLYHILGWAISPINWIFVWDLNFPALFTRIEASDNNIELILATNPNIEWEATVNYIKEEIEKKWLKYKTKTTRLSRWLSSWYIEYADNITLINSMNERKEI